MRTLLRKRLRNRETASKSRKHWNAIKNKQALDSRLIHYVKRRFLEKETTSTPNDLDQWFENVLSDPNTHAFQPLKKGDDDGSESGD